MRTALKFTLLLLLGAVCLAPSSAQAPARRRLPPVSNERRQEAAFHGTDVRLELTIAEFDIVPGASDHIVITWSGKTANNASASINLEGEHATIRAGSTRSNDNDVHFRIELPPDSTVSAKIKVGETKIGPFNGSIDADLGVGELQISIQNPNAYSSVTASTSVGDIDSGPFSVNSRTSHLVGAKFDFRGHGTRHIDAHVATGEIKFINGTPI